MFNSDVNQLQEIHKEIFGVDFQPRELFGWELIERKVPCVSENCSLESSPQHVDSKVFGLMDMLKTVDGPHSKGTKKSGEMRGDKKVEHVHTTLPLNEMIDHVHEKHDGMRMTVSSDGCIESDWSLGSEGWDHKDIIWNIFYCDFSGHTFILRRMKREGIFYLFMVVLEGQDAASKFVVDLQVMNQKTNGLLKFPDMRVYPIDMKWHDIIKDGDGVLFFDQRLACRLFSVSDTDDKKRYTTRCNVKIKKEKL